MSSDNTPALLLLLGSAAALYYWSTTQAGSDTIAEAADDVGDYVSGVPRGVRNNNPGNIIRNGIAWNGLLTQAQVQNNGWEWDPVFCQFDTADNGLRALAKILMTYAAKGIDTIQGLISTFSATNQQAYVTNVSAALQVDPGKVINVTQNIYPIMAAIIQQENGEQPYTTDTLIDAISAASQG